jgi:hypothetical protein
MNELNPKPKDLMAKVRSGSVRILVPMDSKVSPWNMPMFFELSPNQAVELIKNLIKSPALQLGKVGWVERWDGAVAIIPKERWLSDHDHNGVPGPKPPDLHGRQDSRPSVWFHDAVSLGLPANGS